MGKLRCPLCGDYTSFSPVLLKGKGILTKQSSEDRTVYGEVKMRAVAFECEGAAYAILECQSCGECFVAEAKPKFSDNWAAVYPILHKPVAKEIPEPIRSEFEEAHLCFAVGAYRSCLLTCGSALEASWRQQQVSGLQDLKDKGIISPSLYNQANEVRLWGNAVRHDQPMPQVVTGDDAEQLLTYLDAILNAIYIEPKRLAASAQKRQQLKGKDKP